MKENEQSRYIERQKHEWSSVAPAWQKWDDWLDRSMSSCNNRILELARVSSGKKNIDLGSGTGHPAIPAALAVGEHGLVAGLDLSDEMLRIARLKSRQAGLNNISFHSCDVTTIPFKESHFDAMTSRFCLMFLPDLAETLNESFRVLKTGSWFAAAVWGEKEKNPAFMIPHTILKKYIDIPAPDPGMPGLFALSGDRVLKSKAEKAGFSNVSEEKFTVNWIYSSGREFLNGFRDLAAPFKPLVNQLSSDDLKDFEESMIKHADEYRSGDSIMIEGETIIVDGKK